MRIAICRQCLCIVHYSISSQREREEKHENMAHEPERCYYFGTNICGDRVKERHKRKTEKKKVFTSTEIELHLPPTP